MSRVHLTPWCWAVVGVGALLAVDRLVPSAGATGLSIAGWAVGIAYLVASSSLLSIGLRRRGMPRLGPANAVTATRSMLVGVIAALVATALTQPVAPTLIAAIAAPALALDAVDGFVARRTRSTSELGARFDMEVDAILMLVLSVHDVRLLGPWVLALGLMRYAFVAAGWVLPWMRGTLPPRYWRKVVAAVCGIALAFAASELAPPPIAIAAVALAFGLLLESFGRDVVTLVRARSDAAAAPQTGRTRDITPSPATAISANAAGTR